MLWRWQVGTIIQESVFICKAQQNGGGGLGSLIRENVQGKLCHHTKYDASSVLFITREI